jgi:hypothetical protein
MRSSQNALVHGAYNWEAKASNQRVKELLAHCKEIVRAMKPA